MAIFKRARVALQVPKTAVKRQTTLSAQPVVRGKSQSARPVRGYNRQTVGIPKRKTAVQTSRPFKMARRKLGI